VITSGTAGGVGQDTELGDVAVPATVGWDCQEQFKSEPWAAASYPTSELSTEMRAALARTGPLIDPNTNQIPAEYRKRPIKVWGLGHRPDDRLLRLGRHHRQLRAARSGARLPAGRDGRCRARARSRADDQRAAVPLDPQRPRSGDAPGTCRCNSSARKPATSTRSTATSPRLARRSPGGRSLAPSDRNSDASPSRTALDHTPSAPQPADHSVFVG